MAAGLACAGRPVARLGRPAHDYWPAARLSGRARNVGGAIRVGSRPPRGRSRRRRAGSRSAGPPLGPRAGRRCPRCGRDVSGDDSGHRAFADKGVPSRDCGLGPLTTLLRRVAPGGVAHREPQMHHVSDDCQIGKDVQRQRAGDRKQRRHRRQESRAEKGKQSPRSAHRQCGAPAGRLTGGAQPQISGLAAQRLPLTAGAATRTERTKRSAAPSPGIVMPAQATSE